MYAECKVLIFRARTVIVIRHIQNVCDRAGSSALLTFRWSCLLLHQDKLNESTHRLLLVAHSQSENYVSWIYHGIAVANKYHWMALPYHSQDQSMHNKTNARIQRARKTMKKTSEMNIKLYNFVCIYCLKLSIHRKIERESTSRYVRCHLSRPCSQHSFELIYIFNDSIRETKNFHNGHFVSCSHSRENNNIQNMSKWYYC